MMEFLFAIPLAVLAWSVLKGMLDGAHEIGGNAPHIPVQPFLPDFGERSIAK
ncbi:hypothetical protein [Methylobrevis albus]|uniref:Uncharacterized protein n=1 Tax=Methylobrevis albus TaxID=2793297 RepID=A0A931I3L4_9HYPH|nr:hypothetical protein [Methylobrevis albus]MBH0239232.1 hypothetical protein [Methylobrevis albus]